MFSLSPQQSDAVKKIRAWFANDTVSQPTFTLGGFAGTGKSTILPDILEAVGLSTSQIAFAAPTGKAAKVMGEKLKDQGIKAIPTTIHKLIYQPKMQKASVLERELEQATREMDMLIRGEIAPPFSGDMHVDLKEYQKKIAVLTKDLDRAYDINDLRFSLNPEGILVKEDIRLIIIDEGSMVGQEVAEDLSQFEIPILVMGDPGQLPPVGDTPGYFLPDELPDAFLTEVHRQAADNPIIHLATLARKGQRGDYGDYGNGVMVVSRRNDEFTLDLERDCQVIVGTNKTRWKLTKKMRKAGDLLDDLPMKGEPLIICKNDRRNPKLVNGTQVFAADDHGSFKEGEARFLAHIADEDNEFFKVFAYQGLFEEHHAMEKNASSAPKNMAYKSRIEDTQIDFCWAMTCHKSQGSQFDEVIVHDESASFRQDADKWLYTAITRAAKRLIIVS